MEKYFVTVALFAVANLLAWSIGWARLKSQVDTNKNDIKEILDKLGGYMTISDFRYESEISTLKMMTHVSREVKSMKDEILDAINGKQIRWGVLDSIKKKEDEEKKTGG